MRRCLPLLSLALVACSSETSYPPAPTDASADARDSAVVDTAPAETPADTAATCASDETRCGSDCVKLISDPAHCGACGKACASDQVCVGASCACATGKTRCGSACVDTQSDDTNCGACGKACATGEACVEGKCLPPCPTGQTRCGALCVDTQSDAKNCGACGKTCATGESCGGGVCGLTCDYPEKPCSGKCVNVGFDVNNCGACGKVCPTGSNGTPGCTSGSCVLTCATGYGNCDDDATNGCEITLANSDKNCGVCGKACTTTETCLSSKCECKTGTTRCSGACVDTTSSDTNCGLCGRVCPAGESCAASTCQCKTGFTRCGTTCTDTKTDANNCGGCGTACGAGKVCSAGMCCPAGQIACGGVCIDPSTDPTNCGACGTACSGTTAYCAAGTCAGACGAGTSACSFACVDTTKDPKNCGVCGKACLTTEVCFGGACVQGGFPGSGIVNVTQGTRINEWVGTPGQLWQRCYSKVVNGASTATFHSLCNAKGATVTIARLNSSGTIRIMGGYNTASWSSTSGYAGSSANFLFSITNDFKHTYPGTATTSTSYAYNNSTYGPTFGGGHDWYVNSTMNGGYCYLGHTYKCRVGTYPSTTCQADLCGTYSTWTIEDLEVWFK